MFLSSIIHAHVGDLFPGMKVTGCYQFRVTRNSDLFVDEEEVDDLLRAAGRRTDVAPLSAMKCAWKSPTTAARRWRVSCSHQFGLDEVDLFRVNGPVNLNRLFGSATIWSTVLT